MKKRFMSLLLVLVMVFSLLPISAMASVYPINEGSDAAKAPKVVFHNGDAELSTQYLSSSDATVYDPGVPEVDARQAFLGWCLEADLSDKAMTIEEVNTYVKTNYGRIKANGVLNVYAKVMDTYFVTYVAPEVVKEGAAPQTITQKVEAVYVPVGADSYEFTVDVGYTPLERDQNFNGWIYEDDPDLKKMDDTITVSPAKDVTLTADVDEGYWITFDENDRPDASTNYHATYQAPVFVEQGGTLNPNNGSYNVKADGYTFDGWYTAKTGGERVTSVSAEQTVYAHWTAGTASYRVIYWVQKTSDAVGLADNAKSYDYYDSRTASATTGTTVQTNTNDTNASRISSPLKNYVTYNSTKSNTSATLAGDGSTVLNVYYDRATVTFNFIRESGYTFKTISNYKLAYDNSNYYIKINDSWHQIAPYGSYVWNASAINNIGTNRYITYTYYGTRYNDARYSSNTYTIDESASGTSTYQGLYGAPFTEWPTLQDGQVWANSSNNPYATTFPLPVKQFTPQLNNGGTNVDNFYITSDGTSYNLYVIWMDTEGNYPEGTSGADQCKWAGGTWYPTETFEGFTVNSYRFGTSGSWTSINPNGSTTETNSDLYLRYSRNQWNLVYNSNNAEVKKETVYYDKELSGYASYTPTNGPAGTYFEGWYADPGFTQKFDFDSEKMPDHAVNVYANWVPIEYRVQLHLDGGTGIADWFKVDYLDDVKITKNPEKDGYVLVGWYKDENYTQRYNLDTKLTNDTVTSTTYREDGKPTVQGKLDLYAKWRKVLQDPGYISVVYDADGKGTAPVDARMYSDNAETAVETAPTDVQSGYVFEYWMLLDKDKKDIGHYFPGEDFTVLADNAVYDSDVPSYTVTLKAVYGEDSDNQKTTLTYDPNGGAFADGSTDPKTENNLLVNGEVTLLGANEMEDGFLFLGWNHDKTAADNHVVEFQPGQKVGVDDLPDASNTLYAVWDQTDNHNYVIDFNGKMTIATSATAKKDDSHNNGAFEVADGNATYQLKNNEDSFANGANLAFNGIDTALINGVPVGSAAGTTASWEKYTVIPANNVYFDDDLVGKSMTVGDGSGYNAEVSKYNDAASGQEKTKIEITFTGTGIDVYCTTPNANGWIQATVDGTNKQPYTNTKYQGENAPLHNIPVISFRDLGTGEHKLVITTLTGANFQLDGIRVYNGMQDATGDDATTVNNAYAAAKEQNAVFMQVRQYLLDSNTFGSLTSADDDTQAFTGALFVDTKQTGATVSDYQKDGPKNEVYLDAGQGVAFQIKGWANFKDTNKVMVGLSVPAGETATVAASGRTGNNKIKLDAETHMFYTITPDESGNVYIYNTTGSAMVSVTDLKITGTQQYAAPATFTLGAPITPESEGGALTVSPKLLMRYVQDFDPEAVIEDPQVIDEPQTPETPDDGDKPGWNDNSYNPMTILKNLFQNLLNSLSSLFGGLGKW